MEPTNQMNPGWSEPVLPPPLTFTERPVARRRLLPVWLGLVLASAGFFALVALIAINGTASLRPMTVLCGLPAFVYYFFVINRMIKVLEEEPGWSAEYTAAGVVWRQFIPFYGIYFMYLWTGDVERYINWRTGSAGKSGLITFLLLMLGFLSRFYDSFLGLLIIFVALYFLVRPLRRALRTPAPVDVAAPGYEGSLGLR